MKPTERFSNRVEAYRHRPGYPLAVIDFIIEQSHLVPGAHLADIGSGSGILTRLLLEAGFLVHAVEPNEAMRTDAEQNLSSFPGFVSHSGTAENTGLSNASLDALTCAQAFHWFDRASARREFTRVLKPDAWVFLIWNQWRDCDSPFNVDYKHLLEKSGLEQARMKNHSQEDAANLEAFFLQDTFNVRKFPNPHHLTWESLRSRFLSSSYVPVETDPACGPLLKELFQIFERHQSGDQVCLDQETRVYSGRMA